MPEGASATNERRTLAPDRSLGAYKGQRQTDACTTSGTAYPIPKQGYMKVGYSNTSREYCTKLFRPTRGYTMVQHERTSSPAPHSVASSDCGDPGKLDGHDENSSSRYDKRRQLAGKSREYSLTPS